MDNNYVGSLDEEDTPEINSQPSPAFDDLRGIEFTSEPSLAAVQDPEPTTYRAPIDFELGTTAATGIEVEDIVFDNVENKIYDEIPDANLLTKAMEHYLNEHNSVSKAPIPLVMFR